MIGLQHWEGLPHFFSQSAAFLGNEADSRTTRPIYEAHCRKLYTQFGGKADTIMRKELGANDSPMLA